MAEFLTRISANFVLVVFSVLMVSCASNPLVSSITTADDAEAIRLIEQGDIDISERDFWSGLTPLHHAVREERTEVVQALVANDVDLNVPTEFREESALHLANSEEIASILVSAGIDLDAKEVGGLTPLLYRLVPLSIESTEADLEQGVEIALAIVGSGRDFDLQADDHQGMSALHHAARLNVLELSQQLLALGADAEALDYSGRRPYEVAAVEQHGDIIKLFIEEAEQTPQLIESRELSVQASQSELPLLIDDSLSSTAMGFFAYGKYQQQVNEPARASDAFATAKEHFELAINNLVSVIRNIEEEIPKADDRRAAQVAGGVLLNVVGVALAGTTGTGFVATTGVTDQPTILRQRLGDYSDRLDLYETLLDEIASQEER